MLKMSENKKDNQYNNTSDNLFENYDLANEVALEEIWYEHCYIDGWDGNDYSFKKYIEIEDSGIIQDDVEYQIYSDYCQDFIKKLLNQ